MIHTGKEPVSLAGCTAAVGGTPLVDVRVRHGRRQAVIGVKLEFHNPTGSSKDRTAAGLLRAIDAQSPLRPGSVVVESTSGNLGLALARILHGVDCRFIAVVDPRTPPEIRHALSVAGAEMLRVSEPDDDGGGYLRNRLRVIRELCVRHPEYRWTNQYDNPANPAIHEATTGPEIVAQAGPDLDAIYVAVSTGGTLAGISRHVRLARPRVRLVAVDAEGSVALGGRPARRLLSGIGANRRSSFLTPDSYDAVHRVSDEQSFAMCRLLRRDTGIEVGGSSGSALFSCLADVLGERAPCRPVCVLPDSGRNYRSLFYDDRWLATEGILGAVSQIEREVRARGVRFEFDATQVDPTPPGRSWPGAVSPDPST